MDSTPYFYIKKIFLLSKIVYHIYSTFFYRSAPLVHLSCISREPLLQLPSLPHPTSPLPPPSTSSLLQDGFRVLRCRCIPRCSWRHCKLWVANSISDLRERGTHVKFCHRLMGSSSSDSNGNERITIRLAVVSEVKSPIIASCSIPTMVVPLTVIILSSDLSCMTSSKIHACQHKT